jgi:hypothetical protein
MGADRAASSPAVAPRAAAADRLADLYDELDQINDYTAEHTTMMRT